MQHYTPGLGGPGAGPHAAMFGLPPPPPPGQLAGPTSLLTAHLPGLQHAMAPSAHTVALAERLAGKFIFLYCILSRLVL